MKYKTAEAIGKEMGLKHPAEFINNILLHWSMLFTYDKAEDEINELIEDAKKIGIKFCPTCGAAMINGKCYMKDLTHKSGEINNNNENDNSN